MFTQTIDILEVELANKCNARCPQCPRYDDGRLRPGLNKDEITLQTFTNIDKDIIKNGYKLTNLIHPHVELPKCFKIGLGNIIFGNVHISFEVNINNFSIISNFCDLGHNLISGNCITVMPGVTIGGNCNIGAHTLIGSGSIIYQGTRIGENCKIGMGTLITNNLKNNSVVVDQPRKIIRNVE